MESTRVEDMRQSEQELLVAHNFGGVESEKDLEIGPFKEIEGVSFLVFEHFAYFLFLKIPLGDSV